MKFFDKYNLEARLLPAIIASLPFLVLYFFFLNKYFSDFFKFIFGIKLIGDISISVVFLVLLSFVGRAIAKDIFESRWFKSDETQMPTTELLLHSNTEYSANFKSKIHQRIRKDFEVDIFSADAELKNETAARKVIAEAVALIRHRIKNGRLLLNRNIEYGFIRNLIGCSVIAVFISIPNICIFSFAEGNEQSLIIMSAVLTFLYLVPIVFSKILIRNHGKRYARTLFQEYIG